MRIHIPYMPMIAAGRNWCYMPLWVLNYTSQRNQWAAVLSHNLAGHRCSNYRPLAIYEAEATLRQLEGEE